MKRERGVGAGSLALSLAAVQLRASKPMTPLSAGSATLNIFTISSSVAFFPICLSASLSSSASSSPEPSTSILRARPGQKTKTLRLRFFSRETHFSKIFLAARTCGSDRPPRDIELAPPAIKRGLVCCRCAAAD